MRLHLFEKITGVQNTFPTKKQGANFIRTFKADQLPFAELFTFILTKTDYGQIEFEDVLEASEITDLFASLDNHPLSEPVLYEIKNFPHKNIGAWITCNQIKDAPGVFYTIILTDEDPTQIVFYCEVRTCQVKQEPAVVFYNKDHGPEVISKEHLLSSDNWLVRFCINLLKYINEKHLDTFISLDRAHELEEKKVWFDIPLPRDEKLAELLDQLIQKKVYCLETIVEIDTIIPFSYDHFFKIPVYIINQAEKIVARINDQGLLVYWDGKAFIMSDDYTAYFVLRKAGYKKIKAIVLGKKLPKGFKLIKKGYQELLPGLIYLKGTGYDQLTYGMKELVLEKYIDQLNTIKNLNSIIDARCIVLTEDSDTSLLEAVLLSNGFNIDESEIFSYKNCTNLDSLGLTVNTFKSINPRIKIIIHRDRDYLVPSEVDKIKARIIASGALPFVTRGTDIESYFINAESIHKTYPNIKIERITEIINEATEATKEEAINNIKKYEHGDRYKNKPSYLSEFIDQLYETNRERYRPGKKTLGVLLGLLQKEIKSNPDVIKPSEFLRDTELSNISRLIWTN